MLDTHLCQLYPDCPVPSPGDKQEGPPDCCLPLAAPLVCELHQTVQLLLGQARQAHAI